MSIQVVCSGCKKRFQVSEKFAGKKGPCPSCKAIITIPEKAEEVTIHAPEEAKRPGGSAAPGLPTFKPMRRAHLTASPVMIVSVVGGVILTFVIALVIRMSTSAEQPIPTFVLALGSVLLDFAS